MRNFSKTLISMAAVMAVGSAMAAGAMAADMAATYDAETGVVTITDAVSNGASNTLLIVKGGANTAATEETIKQIDQVDEDKAFTSAVLGTGLVAGDTYELRVGGTNGTMQTVVFAIPSNEEQPKTEPIKVGDANGDNSVNLTDATCVLNRFKKRASNPVVGTPYYTGDAGNDRTKEDGSNHKIGDANGDNSVNLTDATCILNRFKKRASNPVVGTPYYTGDAGNEIHVVVK